MQGLPARAVTSRGRGLLPHVFILTFNKLLLKAVIFCGTRCLRLPEARLLTGAWHCAVRTFLPFWKRRIDDPVCSGAKISSLPGAVADALAIPVTLLGFGGRGRIDGKSALQIFLQRVDGADDLLYLVVWQVRLIHGHFDDL